MNLKLYKAQGSSARPANSGVLRQIPGEPQGRRQWAQGHWRIHQAILIKSDSNGLVSGLSEAYVGILSDMGFLLEFIFLLTVI